MILVGPSAGGPFELGGQVHLERSAGQREARKRWFQSDAAKGTREALDEGAKVFIAAIPVRSWQPVQVQIEQPPPRLHI